MEPPNVLHAAYSKLIHWNNVVPKVNLVSGFTRVRLHTHPPGSPPPSQGRYNAQYVMCGEPTVMLYNQPGYIQQSGIVKQHSAITFHKYGREV